MIQGFLGLIAELIHHEDYSLDSVNESVDTLLMVTVFESIDDTSKAFAFQILLTISCCASSVKKVLRKKNLKKKAKDFLKNFSNSKDAPPEEVARLIDLYEKLYGSNEFLKLLKLGVEKSFRSSFKDGR